MLSARDLYFKRGESEILSGINLDISAQTRVVIYGSNGSGKSTLLKLCAGLLEPTLGEVVTKDELKIGYLFQDSSDYFIAPTLLEDVAFSLFVQGVRAEESISRAKVELERLKIAHLAERSLYHLSGGERRAGAIAGILVGGYDLWLLDEPTNELDSAREGLILQILQESSTPFVIISHDSSLASALNAKSAWLKNGKLVYD